MARRRSSARAGPVGSGRRGQGPSLPALSLLVAAAFAAASAPAWAGDFAGRADVGYNHSDANTASASGFRQNYMLIWQHPVTSSLGYRLSLRYQDDRARTAGAARVDRLTNSVLVPSGEVVYRVSRLDVRAGGELRYENTRASGLVAERSGRDSRRAFADTRVELAEPLDLRLSGDRLSTVAPESQIDTVENRAAVGFEYDAGGLRLIQTTRVEQFQDATLDFSRLVVGPRLVADYRQSFLGDAVSLGARYSIDYNRFEERALGATAIAAPREIAPLFGLYARRPDELPVTSMGPLNSVAALVDRDLGTSAGIALGVPEGASFQNIGVDMGRFVDVDRLRIHVRDARGNLLSAGGPIGWTVFSSADGLQWTEVSPPALATYNDALGLWEIDFGTVPQTPQAQPDGTLAPVNARFFKVETFGVNTVPTFVTEIQAFVRESFRPQETRLTSNLVNSANVMVSAKPFERLILGYSGLVNEQRLSPNRGPAFRSYDWLHSFLATAGPYRLTTVTVSHTQRQAVQAGGASQRGGATTLGLRFTPMRQAEAGLELRRVTDDVPGFASTTHGLGLRGRADLLETLRLQAAADYNLQDIQGDGSRDFATFSGSTLARLTRALDLSLNGAVQVVLSGENTRLDPTVPFPRLVAYQRYYVEGNYHPSFQLSLLARVGYTFAQVSGPVQNYRVSWNPFPDGAIQIGIDYGEDVDALTGNSSRRLSLWPRWNINRHAYLDLNYTFVVNRGFTDTRVGQFFATLSVSI